MSGFTVDRGSNKIIYGTSTIVVGPSGIGFYPFHLRSISEETAESFLAFLRLSPGEVVTVDIDLPTVERMGDATVTSWKTNKQPVSINRDETNNYVLTLLPS